MKTKSWKLPFWVVLLLGLVQEVQWAQEDPAGAAGDVRVVLKSPPGDLTLVGPTSLPLIAEVSGVETGEVMVEFLNGETSLGLADSPFNVLPETESEDDSGPSGIYMWTWDDVPAGTHELQALLLLDGVVVARSEQATVDLVLIDEQPVVDLIVSDPIAAEGGESGVDAAEFLVKRSGPTEMPLEVFIEWSGDAVLGEDFMSSTGSVVIEAGETTAVVAVQPIDDSVVEGDEKAVLTILPPVCIDVFPPPADCYLVGRDFQGSVTVRDNDQPSENEPPMVLLTEPLNGQTFREGSSVELVAHAWDMDGDVRGVEFYEGDRLLGTVAVESDSDEGSDPAPEDPNGLPLPPERNIVSFIWNEVPEGRFSLTAKAIDNEGAGTESPAVSIAVVGVETPPVVTITSVDAEAREGGSTGSGRPTRVDSAVFEIKREGGQAGSLVVGLGIEGSATNGRDYARIPNRVTIPRDANSVRVEIRPMDDRAVEGTENVVLVLQPSDCRETDGRRNRCYVVGRVARAQAEILDDDRSNDSVAPSVAIVRPRDGSEFNESQTINLFAEAKDRDGRVVAVEFYANGEKIGGVRNQSNGRQTNRFFRFQFKKPAAGRYEIVAVATDNDGMTARSEPITISVGVNLVRPVVSVRALDAVAAEFTPRDNDGREPDTAAARAVANTATFLVSRSGLVDVPLAIPYRLSGTAENGVDYRELSGVVELASGETRARITIVPIDDTLVEGRETVAVELLPAVCLAIFPPPEDCYSLGRAKEAKATIRDNDKAENQRPRIELVDPMPDGVPMAPADFVLQANTKDEDGFVRQVVFFANGRRIGTARAERDQVTGEVQTFKLEWNDVGPGRYELVAVAMDNRDGETRSEPVIVEVIESVVLRTVVSVEAIDPKAAETNQTGSRRADVGTFRFSRRGNLQMPVEVFYRIGGSAVNGVDYQEVASSFVFEAGEAAVDLMIEPIDDDLVEGTEGVEVALVPPVCAEIFPPLPSCYELGENATASLRIADNDRGRNLLPRVAIVQPRTRASFQQPANIEVRVEALDRDGWVGQIELYSGDALIAEQTLTFIREPDPGQKQHFTLLWENAPVGEHGLVAVVTDSMGGTSRSRKVTITVKGAADLPVVTVFARDAFATEPDGNRPANSASVRVRRTGKLDEPLTVHYLVEGTAENGVDYETLPGVIEIPARKRWATVKINPLADTELERAESVVIRLAEGATDEAPETYTIGRPGRAGVVIRSQNQVTPGSERLADGIVHVCIPAPNGRSFRIEAGSALGEWDVIGTSTVTDEAVHIVDTESADTEVRFFRIIPDIDQEAEEGEN